MVRLSPAGAWKKYRVVHSAIQYSMQRPVLPLNLKSQIPHFNSQLPTPNSQLPTPNSQLPTPLPSPSLRAQHGRHIVGPLAQFGKRHDADAVFGKDAGNKLVTHVAARGLAFGDGQKFGMRDAPANGVRREGQIG